MSKKTIILLLCITVVVLLANIIYQRDRIICLEKTLSMYEVDAVTKEVVIYNYVSEERTEDEVYEAGYDDGYHEGYWDGFHDLEEGYEGFLDSELFENAFEEYMDALYK